jgi:hypothetical protein
MRVASLCVFVTTHGLPDEMFTELLDFWDAHFPGAFGDLNHSTSFVTRFRTSLLETQVRMHRRLLHARLPALRVPSHFFRALDGVTPKCGDPLLPLVHVITNAMTGLLHPLLLDMPRMSQDVPAKAVVPVRLDDEDCVGEILGGEMVELADMSDFLLSYHKPEKVADLVIHTEAAYGVIDQHVQLCKAMDCTDGAYIGPGTGNKIVKLLNAKQGVYQKAAPGKLDSWHGLVKALEHSDRLEQQQGHGLVTRYYAASRAVRKYGAFGEGQKVLLLQHQYIYIYIHVYIYIYFCFNPPKSGSIRTAINIF